MTKAEKPRAVVGGNNLATQLEVAAHWLEEAKIALFNDRYLRENLARVREECLAAANDNAARKEAA